MAYIYNGITFFIMHKNLTATVNYYWMHNFKQSWSCLRFLRNGDDPEQEHWAMSKATRSTFLFEL